MARRMSKAKAQEKYSINEQKWTPTLMEAGFTVIPLVLLERQQALGLDAIDINILLHIAKHWWFSDNPPHPSKRSIAECMGIDPSTVRKRIARMELDGLIERKPRFDGRSGQTSNSYHFDGLIKHATPFAEESLEARKEQQEEESKRRIRKKPKKTRKESGEEK